MANPGDEHAAGNIPLEMPPERTELERTWTAILQEIAKLSDAMGLDSGDWAEADDCTLGQEFDPWVVLREATKRASAWEADIAYIETLKTALTNLLHLAEQDEIQIEEEWGDGMTLEWMEAAGELAKEIVLARAALAASGPQVGG